MRNRFLMTSAALVLGLSLIGAACSDDETTDETTTTEAMAEETTTTAAEEEATEGETIVDIAVGNPDFSTLVTAVTEAGLAETLSGEGPFTVFAPTNAAFEALPAGTLDTLLADPTGDLTSILQLHVIAGEVDSAAAAAAVGTCVETLGGPVLVDEDADGNLTFGGAVISDVDIEGSNGIIHVIDSVVVAESTDCPAS
jgi:uncharacterized surface protein with fasciclin (FAS1) repeats